MIKFQNLPASNHLENQLAPHSGNQSPLITSHSGNQSKTSTWGPINMVDNPIDSYLNTQSFQVKYNPSKSECHHLQKLVGLPIQ